MQYVEIFRLREIEMRAQLRYRHGDYFKMRFGRLGGFPNDLRVYSLCQIRDVGESPVIHTRIRREIYIWPSIPLRHSSTAMFFVFEEYDRRENWPYAAFKSTHMHVNW